ncbi:MAG: hypothetical protein ABJL54_10505 [Halioglobus sp.]
MASPVIKDGKEWLQPLSVVSVSWNDISARCLAGYCSGTLGGVDVTGYTWASAADITDLLVSYGAPGIPSTNLANTWSTSFFSDFNGRASASGSSLRGMTSDERDTTNGQIVEMVYSVGSFERTRFRGIEKTLSSFAVGSFFWRDATFTVGGILSGLAAGDDLVIQSNGGDDLTLTADGAFTFPTPLADGATYTVTVQTQPTAPAETCTVTNGSGTLSGSDVSNVSITCVVDTFTIGGTVSGLAAGNSVVLQNNGADNQSIIANGPFTFSAPLADLTGYSVTVFSQPDSPSQSCTLLNESGTLAGANVTNVEVSCVTNTYTIGGNIAGLVSGDSIEIQNNSGDNLILNADGGFTFSQPLNDGSPYLVTILSQPPSPSETCNVADGSGNLAGADVTGVYITCTINPFTVGGTLTGLETGETVILQNNGADDLALTADGGFTFATPLDDGTTYTVAVNSQPSGKTCITSGGSGSLTGANVTSVAVTCLTDTTPAPPPQPSAQPVPATPVWLLWIMASLLAGLSWKRWPDKNK